MKSSDLISRYIGAELDPAFAARSKKIVQYILAAKPKRILDAGCGRGFYLKLLTYFDFVEEIAGIDVNKDYLDIARSLTKSDNRVNINQASIYKLPFHDNYFDFVICSEVLEHVEDDKRAVRELYRVLKKGGHLAVTVPHINFPLLMDPVNWLLMRVFHTHINKNVWWLAGMWADHERLYSEKDIRSLLHSKFYILHTSLLVHWCWPFTHLLLYGIGKNLIERCGIATDFSRFEFQKKSALAALLATLTNLPSRVLDARIPTHESVNLCFLAQKR